MLSDLEEYPNYAMHNLTKRYWRIVFKWSVIILIILGLWFIRIIWLIIVLLQLLSQEFWRFLGWIGSGTKEGGATYWELYGTYWMIAYLAIAGLVALEYFSHYRRKRPDLVKGGKVEGRVLWIKGIRRGLIYDVWDFWNYVYFVIGKKKDMDYWTQTLKENMAIRNGTKGGILKWPDPLAIPWGRRSDRRYLIYYCRPWSLKWVRLEVPLSVIIQPSFFLISIPNLNILARLDRVMIGRTIYRLSDNIWQYDKYDPLGPYIKQRDEFVGARGLIQSAVAINPETNIIDFTEGSLPVPGLKEKKRGRDNAG